MQRKSMYKIAESINILAEFLGPRDLSTLTKQALKEKYGISQADTIILFGGSIPCGADVAANGVKEGVAHKFIICGGEGHTTETLRQNMKIAVPEITTEGEMEADLFTKYLEYRYQILPDYLERESTNCGNNVTNTLAIMKEQNIPLDTMILIQDATMQRRMEAGFRKYLGEEITIINYAAYSVTVKVENDQLVYAEDIWGMWDMDRYITLLMGEIPRLLDDSQGYGPNGKGFIAHVEIPDPVLEAFEYLKQHYGDYVREANPLYASK